MVLKFSKPKVTWSAFSISIIFNNEEVSDNIELIVTSITATKNTQSFNTNAKNKNKNKRRKNNQDGYNNNNTLNYPPSQLYDQLQNDKNCSPGPKTCFHS